MGNKIVKFEKGFQFNIGIFLILITIIYLLFHIFSSLTKKNISVYEVTLGTIVDKNIYKGLALRQEEIIYSDIEGDIYYYEKNKSRVGVRNKIYAVDTRGNTVKKLKSNTENKFELSTEDLHEIYPVVDSFIGGFDRISFYNTYAFKDDARDYLLYRLGIDSTENMWQEIEAAILSGTYHEYTAMRPGFLVYTLDGFEGKTIDDIMLKDFDAGEGSSKNLYIRDKVSVNEPIYKLVTSDDWQIIIPVDENKAKELSRINNINIGFTQDNTSTWATAEIITREDGQYLLLSLDDSMERYAGQRFINVELIMEETEGLKIPNSAICQKDFFVVPKSYFFYGGNTNELGVMVRRGGKKDEFLIPSVYYETKDSYYIDNYIIKAGDKLIKEGSKDIYTVGGNIDSLQGVYNINKGYASFKVIKIVYKSEEYAIVDSAYGYSISLYDHIVLNADTVEENEII